MLDHAIVMGGSIAGLCAAAALAGVSQSVTLLERDARPEGPSARKGTPQCRHVHVLLNLGQRSFERLVPGLLDELCERGAIRVDIGEELHWFIYGSWKPRFTKGVRICLQTRPFLEAGLRDRIAQDERITLRFGTAIDEPIFDAASRTVRGVKLEDGSELSGDFVVDATGRGSKSPKWLEKWGFRRPVQQVVEVGLAYVSGLFESSHDAALATSNAVLIYPEPPELARGGVAFHVEGDRWLVTLFGYHGEHAPTELAGFRAWAGTLAEKDIQRAVERWTLIGKLHKFTYPRQVRNLYERLPQLPARYVVIGDALCSFDPVFGQGMSVAASDADVYSAFLDVLQLDKRPTSLFAPKLLRKVLWGPSKAAQ